MKSYSFYWHQTVHGKKKLTLVGINISKTFWHCVVWKIKSSVVKKRITLLEEIWVKLCL